MNFVIAVFGSRSETLSYANVLKRLSIPVMVIQTPKEAGRSCGLSAKFSYQYFEQCKQVLKNMRYMSFNGFYLEQNVSGRRVISRG